LAASKEARASAPGGSELGSRAGGGAGSAATGGGISSAGGVLLQDIAAATIEISIINRLIKQYLRFIDVSPTVNLYSICNIIHIAKVAKDQNRGSSENANPDSTVSGSGIVIIFLPCEENCLTVIPFYNK
jgi:hypothetical protein